MEYSVIEKISRAAAQAFVAGTGLGDPDQVLQLQRGFEAGFRLGLSVGDDDEPVPSAAAGANGTLNGEVAPRRRRRKSRADETGIKDTAQTADKSADKGDDDQDDVKAQPRAAVGSRPAPTGETRVSRALKKVSQLGEPFTAATMSEALAIEPGSALCTLRRWEAKGLVTATEPGSFRRTKHFPTVPA